MSLSIPPGVNPNEVPGGMPPPGQSPLAANPQSHAYQYYIVAGVVTPFMALCVALRLYVQSAITNSLWWDDLAIVIALIVQIGYTGLVIQCGRTGLGTHAWDLTLAEFLRYYKLVNQTATVTLPAIYFTKLALLLFYYRIFKLNRFVYFGVYFGLFYTTVFYVVAFFMYIFDKDETTGLQLTHAVAIVGVLSDVYIAMLPLVAVKQLHLSGAKRLQVAAVFCIGWVAIALSIVGCVYRFTFDIQDISWSLLPTLIVNTVEIDVGIICASLPVMAALFTRRKKGSWWLTSIRSLRSRIFGSHASRSSSNGSGSSGKTNSSRPKRSDYTKHPSDNRGGDKPGSNVELSDLESGSRSTEAPPALGGITKTTVIEQRAEAV